MTVPVLTAVTDAGWEADLVAALAGADLGVTIVRRCVDLADLLATAATGSARAALLSADLRRLDRDAVAQLHSGGLAVVGLLPAGDEAARQRLHQLGVAHVLPADADPGRIAAAVIGALSAPGGPAADRSEPRQSVGAPATAAVAAGRLVAVWGPTGAPGRSTVAVTLAAELANRGCSTLLADGDVYGGVVAQLLGLLDEAPGLAAAARLANAGGLDRTRLAGLARSLNPTLRVLTGISRADRWPELRPAALEVVWSCCRELAAVTVVDCGFALEQDEELAYDTAAPRRNGATLATLQAADTVLAVGAGDPVGLQRLVRGLSELREVLPDLRPLVIVNRVRRTATGPDPQRQIATLLERYAGLAAAAYVPEDRAGCDAALVRGQPLTVAAPGSPARRALATLAGALAGPGLELGPRGAHRAHRLRAAGRRGP